MIVEAVKAGSHRLPALPDQTAAGLPERRGGRRLRRECGVQLVEHVTGHLISLPSSWFWRLRSSGIRGSGSAHFWVFIKSHTTFFIPCLRSSRSRVFEPVVAVPAVGPEQGRQDQQHHQHRSEDY